MQFERKKERTNEWTYSLILFAAITIPQIVIYAKSNIIDRYLIPASMGCAFLSVFIYRELKKENMSASSPVWKNMAIIVGLALMLFFSLITFNDNFRQHTVDFAVHLQGKVLQGMTSLSSRQYFETSLRTNYVFWPIAGFLLLWGCFRKWWRIRSVSQLYGGVLVLLLLFNGAIAFLSHKRYATRGYATESLLHTVVDHSASDDIILIAGNIATDGEGLTGGISIWLNEYGRYNLYACPLSGGDMGADAYLLNHYKNKGVNAITDKESIRVLVIFPNTEDEFKSSNYWFNPSTYQRYEYPGNYVVYTKQ